MATYSWRGAFLSAALITGLVAAPQGLMSARAAHSAAASSGATLTITFHDDFSHLDSALCYDAECYAAMKALYDRLVDYDTHHGSGDTIIPDAAAAMPAITNGGRTYTFKLRRDMRFWNGRAVTSADWVYSFERIINPKTKSGGQSFWLNIQGADA
ncbi:MAG: ABC transporter substrate-binding protein, partial [Chloroflexi bacterium]|nr:ABC transporter substrate-binding protein [Chloroflexota bacterium]